MGFVVTVASKQGGKSIVAYPLVPVFRPGMGFSCGGFFVNGTEGDSYAPSTCSFIHQRDAESFSLRLYFLVERSAHFDPASIRVIEATRENPPPAFVAGDEPPATPTWRHLRRADQFRNSP